MEPIKIQLIRMQMVVILDCMRAAYSIRLLFLFLVPHDHEHEHGHEGHEHYISAANESENATVPID